MSDHDHCDHDPIECTYDALVGEYQEAVAERDRLRAVVHEQDYALALAAHRDAERDRLRAVVDAVRRASHLYWIAESADFDNITPVTVAMTKVELALRQLDVSPEATDG